MVSATAITIYLFGFSALFAGVYNLLYKEKALDSLGLPNTQATIPASDGMALAATAMGIYYPLAAYQENRAFFVLTVPMRLLTATTFSQYGPVWRPAALWEGSGAVLTAVALVWDYSRSESRSRH